MLQEFVSAQRVAILHRARAKVAARCAPKATEEELAKGIPLFLDQLIGALRNHSATSAVAMEASATLHGRDLLERGFTVARLVRGYGGVREAVTELADELNAPITAAELQTFNQCLDDAIAQAVTEYARQRERSIADQGKARSGELAHELRNALGSAMLAFGTITTGSVGPSGSTASLLGRSLRRLAGLVDSSIAQVRLDAKIRSPERVSVREFIEEVEVGASMEASARGIVLAVSLVEPGVDVEADRQLLAAAVANLLQNAFKFSRPKGHVTLTTSATKDRVLIEVEDECGGLPPGRVDELFVQFEQRGRDRTGLGLGLSISRRSVEAEGGEIHVRDLPGVGCVFALDLPRLSAGG